MGRANRAKQGQMPFALHGFNLGQLGQVPIRYLPFCPKSLLWTFTLVEVAPSLIPSRLTVHFERSRSFLIKGVNKNCSRKLPSF